MSETSQPVTAWVSLWGEFDQKTDDVTFRGYLFTPEPKPDEKIGDGAPVQPQAPRGGVGKLISDQRLTDGRVSVDIEFDEIDPTTTAEIILHHDPATDEMLNVGLGAGGSLVAVRHWSRSGDKLSQQSGSPDGNTPHWNTVRFAGDRRTMRRQRSYHLQASIQGSFMTVELDGVELGSGSLPFQLAGKQVGFFAQSQSDIHFRHFRVETTRPLAFVVMQFDPPEYEELFNDVIVPVCEKMKLEPFRASQAYYPGLVIADIQRQIRESRVVIAEITPVNPNVYYEVGYADAIGKPVILIADAGKLDQLPFDVRAFRTLFYENSIGGKNKVEKTLTDFLQNIMNQKS
jgi:hypothetical protein